MRHTTTAFGSPAAESSWLRALREWCGVGAVAILLTLVGAFSRPTMSFETPTHITYTLIVIGCCAAVLVSHRLPRVSLVVVTVLLALHLLVVPESGVFALVMCFVAVYTAQTTTNVVERLLFTVVVMTGAAAWVVNATAELGENPRTRGTIMFAMTAVLSVAVLAGAVRRQARHRYIALVERAAALEAQHDTERRLAAAEERARIAREMHDILGHSLNAIAVQAEGARCVLHTAPVQAETALGNIGQLSRAAVDEVRDLIDVLHTGDEPSYPRPAPALAELPELIGTFPGTTIRLNISGDLSDVPSHVALSGYRIVQEALTNAVKHAPHAPVTVRVAVSAGIVELVIVNSATPRPVSTPPGAGYGLIGMRERARALGGTLEAGPDTTTGGWKVTARLPRSRA